MIIRVFTAHEHENSLLNIGISTCANTRREEFTMRRRGYDVAYLDNDTENRLANLPSSNHTKGSISTAADNML